MRENLAPLLRSFGFIGFVCCAATLNAQAALAADMPAHVDLSQPHPQPPYPDSARADSEQGSVLIDVQVKPSGRPGKFRVAQSSGYGDLDDAAVASVLNWRFVPAMQDGETVTDWTTVKVVFELPKTADTAPAPSSQ